MPAPPVGEVEVTLPLAVVGAAAAGALVSARQQVTARLGLGEQRRLLVEDGYSWVMTAKCC